MEATNNESPAARAEALITAKKVEYDDLLIALSALDNEDEILRRMTQASEEYSTFFATADQLRIDYATRTAQINQDSGPNMALTFMNQGGSFEDQMNTFIMRRDNQLENAAQTFFTSVEAASNAISLDD